MSLKGKLGNLPTPIASKLGYLASLLPEDELSQNRIYDLGDLNTLNAEDIIAVARRALDETKVSDNTGFRIRRVLEDIDQSE